MEYNKTLLKLKPKIMQTLACSYKRITTRKGNPATLHRVRHQVHKDTTLFDKIPVYYMNPTFLEYIIILANAIQMRRNVTMSTKIKGITKPKYSYTPSENYKKMREQLKFQL